MVFKLNINELNEHPRDKRIIFLEDPHEYYIDNEKYEGSVTGFIESFFSKFDADEIINKYYEKWQKYNHSEYMNKTKEEIKEIWAETNKKALIKGNNVHNFIDNFFCNMVNNKKDIELKTNELLLKEHSLSEIRYFIDFYKSLSDTITPYRSEWFVFDEEVKLAGSIDCVVKKSDRTYMIIDWKTNKEIKKNNPYQHGTYPLNFLDDCNFNHYQLQLNTYKYILEKNYGIKITGMVLVHFAESNGTYQIYKVNDMQQYIQKMFSIRKNRLLN